MRYTQERLIGFSSTSAGMIDIIGAYILLASGIVANKYVLRSMAPDLLVGIRMLVSGLAIFLYSVSDSPRLRWRYIREDFAKLAFIAICTTLAPSLLKAFALKYMPASKQTLLGSIDPFVTATYAYFIWNDRITLRQFLGMLVAFAGIVVLLISRFPEEQLWGEFSSVSYPEIAALIAVALGRYGWILVQMFIRKDRYAPHEITSLSMLSSGALALILGFFRGMTYEIPQENPWFFISVLCFTTFVGNIGGYTLYSYCLKHHSATLMSISGLLIPVLVASLSSLLGLEVLNGTFFVAMACVGMGMFLFYSKQIASALRAA